MTTINTHHDGFGLNERLRITADEADKSGASHLYTVDYMNEDGSVSIPNVASVQFQKGPRFEDGSVPGITEAVNYAILVDRLEGFQRGPFACDANAKQVELLKEALSLTKNRASERAERGVLGKNEK